MLRSTKAGDASSNQGSSVLYQSYRPTSLVKVGATSVQRLRAPGDGAGHKSRVQEFIQLGYMSATRPATGIDRNFNDFQGPLNRTE